MTPAIETALPKRGDRGERPNGVAVPGPDVANMRDPVRYVNGRAMVAPEPPAEPMGDEFSALELDANQRLEELQEARMRLAPEALADDPAAESELQTVLGEIRAANEVLENVRLARTEQARRAAAAREKEGAEARAAALEEAQRLQVERDPAARAFDSAARKLACALRDHFNVSVAQQRALSAAGRRGGPAAPSAVERAVAYALASADVPRGVIELPPLSGKPAPLAELDPKHVEPAEGPKDVTVSKSSGETEQGSENDG